jgi:disulfide bond formation protein DsbB
MSGSALISSLMAEYAWNLPHCKLCSIQRVLHGMLALAAVFGIFSSAKTKIRTICAILLLGSCVTASYHVLVQYGVLTDRCSVNLPAITNIATFEAVLENTHPPCSEKGFAVFKIPASALNDVFSLLFLLLTIDIILVRKKASSESMD